MKNNRTYLQIAVKEEQEHIYAQALHIDWVVFQNCPINVKILQNFLGSFKTAQSMYGNYPINVKCLRTPLVQAFHIDWVVFKFLAIFWHF